MPIDEEVDLCYENIKVVLVWRELPACKGGEKSSFCQAGGQGVEGRSAKRYVVCRAGPHSVLF